MKLTPYKYAVLLFVGLLSASLASAQTKEITVDGLKIILKQTPKDVVSVRLFIKGGADNYTKEKEGVEDLTLNLAVQGGTRTRDAVKFATEAEMIGAQLGASSQLEFSEINMTCVKMFWDKSWDLFADAVLNPAFDPKEFDLLREQYVANAMSTMSDPDQHLKNLSLSNAFKGSPYERIPSGTPTSLAGISLADVTAQYKKIIGKQRCFLVVVGNISEEDLVAKVKASLAKMPYGSPYKKVTPTLITKGGHFVEHRDIATNYIRGLMSAPTKETAEGTVMQLGMSIMGSRFFLELRTNRSLSYAPAAFYSSGVLINPYNTIYISTQDPKQSMEVMTDIINDIKKNGFLQSELDDKKQGFLTNYYMGQQTTGEQSLTLGMYEIISSWKLAEEFPTQVNNTTLKELNRVFDKYTQAIQWTYLGKQDQVKPEDFKQTVEEKKNKPY
jgi:predicted Zn-dependent peptidase